jgi:hypothetical protein
MDLAADDDDGFWLARMTRTDLASVKIDTIRR